MSGFTTKEQKGYPLTASELATIEALADLGDPGADRIVFWDESANTYKWLTIGTGLTITDTTISASLGTIETLQFDTTPTVGAFSEGKLYYDNVWKTFSAEIDSDVTLQIGQEDLRLVYNNTGATILNGKAVYTTGTYNAGTNDVATVGLAKADSPTTAFVLGLATQNIETGHYGLITVRGHINNLNTDALGNNGDIIYLSAETAGELTTTVPESPYLEVRIGRLITKSTTVGRINIRISQAYRLNDLADVLCPSPITDEVLRWNGSSWVNGAMANSSAGAGIEFFYDGTDIIATGNDNANKVETLSKTPSTAGESVETTVVNNNTILSDIYLYDTALGRTSIDSGVWTFSSYCAVSSATAVSEILHNVVRVRTGAGTVTITDGASATEKIVTASEGTPFSAEQLDVGGTIDSDSFLRTPKGVYRITERTDNTHIKILVPSTYTNESTVAFSVHKKLFQVTTGEINNTATSPLFAGLQLYTTNSVQVAYTILVTDKLAVYRFAKTTRGSNTDIYFSYGGTTRYSHLSSPLVTLHNNLAGLQGGTGSGVTGEFYHLTSAQKTVATQASSGSQDGYLTSANWTTFNSKQDTITTSTNLPVGTIELGHSSDTTIARVSAGLVSIEGNNIITANQDVTALAATSAGNKDKYLHSNASTGALEWTTVAGAGDMVLATEQTVTGLKIFDKDKLSMKGTSTGTTVLSTANTSATSYTQTMQARNGTIANLDNTFFIGTTEVALNRGTGALTLAGITLTAPTLSGVTILEENASIEHDNALSADGKYTGETLAGTAGTTLAFGDLIYLDPTDSKWELVDANIAGGSDGDPRGILGICVLAANENATTKILLRGMVRADAVFPSFTINAPVYISETAGDVTETQPTTTDVVIRIVGFGFDGNTLYFCPDNSYITHT